MLGHVYSAEALVMLDRIPEALLYLKPEFIANLKDEDFIHRGSPGIARKHIFIYTIITMC